MSDCQNKTGLVGLDSLCIDDASGIFFTF